jgi:hypothetical protein
MNPYDPATTSLGTGDRLDQIRLSPRQLRMALASMRQAELISELLMRAICDLRAVFGCVSRSVSALVRRNKVSAATPAWRLP